MSESTGKISVDGNTATITFERHLPHSIDIVWKAITDPEQRKQWYGPTTLEPKEGGTIETIAEGPPAPVEVRRSVGIIIVWDPPNVFEYKEESANVGTTTVRYELTPDGNSTMLRLINSGLKISDAFGYAPGWHAFIDRLASFLKGEQLPEWGRRYSEAQQEYSK
jgi:uncharacterized protein YndB with AHSA1/START domain